MRALKVRLYPTQAQQVLLAKTFGCARFVYNRFLEVQQQRHVNGEKFLTWYDMCKLLVQLKQQEEFTWLREVDKFALETSLRNLADAYLRFFAKQARFPKFKSKYDNRQSYRTSFTTNNIAITDHRHVKLPKLGLVKARGLREVHGRILSATISRTPTGNYYAALQVEETIERFAPSDRAVGIDLGVRNLATLSDGTVIENPQPLERALSKLRQEQRKLSRRKEITRQQGRTLSESHNYQKQRRQVARVHERVADIRHNAQHQITATIIKNHGFVALETLNIRSMLSNKYLSRRLSDAALYEFQRKLEYKGAWHGRVVVHVAADYPSTHLCSHCGYQTARMPLGRRVWTCQQCHTRHDRDVNAAINILHEGLSNRGNHGDSLGYTSNTAAPVV